MFRVIIAGGRDFCDYVKLVKYCDFYLKNKSGIEIVSGNANGADKLGEKYAIERNFSVKSFPADWTKFGKSAGFLRNKQMAEYSDALIAFWNGNSSGTKHMINLATEFGLMVRVVNY
jgi:predicted Rossmann fold nucleotide-binding protein DprA/Smf involved in DNA uptake